MSPGQFDPERSREILLGSCGFEWSLRDNLCEAQAAGGLGGTAAANLGVAIKCLLVGFNEPAELLLKKVMEWVQVAIATNERPERYFPGATEGSRFQIRALCNWLLSDQHDGESLRQYITHEDHYLNSQRRKDKVDVSFTLPTYVNAGAFERALEIFGSTPGLAAPTSSAIRNEAHMAYVISRHALGMEFSRDEVEQKTAKFLKRNVNQWLGNGHWIRAAEWMKIVHWNETAPRPSSREALLKCYDYLPGCQPPT